MWEGRSHVLRSTYDKATCGVVLTGTRRDIDGQRRKMFHDFLPFDWFTHTTLMIHTHWLSAGSGCSPACHFPDSPHHIWANDHIWLVGVQRWHFQGFVRWIGPWIEWMVEVPHSERMNHFFFLKKMSEISCCMQVTARLVAWKFQQQYVISTQGQLCSI
jgi:hypothetical protein